MACKAQLLDFYFEGEDRGRNKMLTSACCLLNYKVLFGKDKL